MPIVDIVSDQIKDAMRARDEMAAAERAELKVVEEFLPKLADEETTRAWVREALGG
ncbi:MAG: GatB/YqeY domain-containing protein [Deltaproteobacteria bacterium]|nr:GatB/YqeY domain-containing protein [Deltaproteobacteria bacterium]MBW2254257.1 GatB/YqeY domain-containing protein [Deltaproteobacteria bacterium]